MLTRRDALIAGASTIVLPAAIGSDPDTRLLSEVRTLEAGLGKGGRIGVRVIDPATGRDFAWRATERFAMCSTFKLLLAGQILYRVDRRLERLGRAIAIPATGILPNSPATKAHAGGQLTVRDLCEAAITLSDNMAANLLLATVGGPAGLTRFLRTTGDTATRLDRYETTLNEASPGDPRDTTTPSAFLDSVRRLTFGPVLSPAARKQLIAWMTGNKTGDEKLRKDLPMGWRVGDKTGAGGHGSNNDIALIWPAGRGTKPPLFVSVFITGGDGDAPLARNPVHARIGKSIAAWTGAI